MTELKAIGLVNMYPDTDTDDNDYGTANVEKEIELRAEFEWFLSDEFAELRGLKEKCTPRARLTSVPVPLLLYEYTLIKKLNLIGDFSFKQDIDEDERPRGGQISFSNDMVLEETSLTDSTEHKSNQYPCDFTKPRNAGKLYRVGHSDRHGCEDCNIKDDIYYMRDHKCSGYKPT